MVITFQTFRDVDTIDEVFKMFSILLPNKWFTSVVVIKGTKISVDEPFKSKISV